MSIDGQKAINAFKEVDILEKIKTAEELRVKVKQIINEVLVEYAEKLIIFIDELDRCKPSYIILLKIETQHTLLDGLI
ncbi:hypothetical protein DW898_12860 [Ruminococcus sp. AM41-2AC]|nr:hypothetical protein DW898_12860 [Ruminococcus sp. AM41-2AC]